MSKLASKTEEKLTGISGGMDRGTGLCWMFVWKASFPLELAAPALSAVQQS
jgi:hypothetical protein